MANFDLDDPLGDLLSDGSNDSFFDEPKVLAKRASISKSPEKKSVTDLFGLDDKPKQAKKDDWLGLDNKKEPAVAPRRAEKPQKKISFEDDDDILNTLGLDSSKPKETKIDSAKKSSLMQSILGPPKEDDKKFLSLDDLLKDSKISKKVELPSEVSQSTSQLPQRSDTASTFGLSSLDAPREGRRGRPKTPAIADPLGLFSNEPKTPEEPVVQPEIKPRKREQPPHSTQKESVKEPETEVIYKPKNASNVPDVPDWLGGTTSSSKPHKSDTELHKVEAIRRSSISKSEPNVPQVFIEENNPIDSILTQQKLAASHIEYQNASIALQQQESQVLMALQLRKYEENLADMQRKQQDVLVNQEKNFNNLLDRQFAKQQIMENNMRLQQERINNHIQLLITQPPITAMTSNEEQERVDELRKTHSDETIKQFEDLITNLKQRQHEETFLLEESYKKQINTLEQSMESVENHLKMELDAVSHKHKEKLEMLDSEHLADITKYKNKIEELHALHANEMKQMRENNNRVLEEIKYEYNTIIENIKMSKQNEQTVLQDASSYSQKLDTSLKLLDINSKSLIDIREKVESDYGVLCMAREESIKAKQEEIIMMRMALEKARESADADRAQMMIIIRNLEIKLAEHSHNSREERFALQQAAATLTARTVALDRESDFNRASLERERDQLKTLRDSILSEQEKIMHEVTEQKLALHAEKSRMETAAKLNQNYDSQRAKAEMEAAMDVAKEAAELTDKERENLLRQLREVESLKRNLIDRERKLESREKDLEAALGHANRKQVVGEKALEEARILQVNYNDRLREIQAQMSFLTLRERKLAEEKIAVSKERLALHNATRQIRKCGLCAVDNVPKIDEDDNISEPVEQDIPRFISVSDADIFRMQLQMSEDQLAASSHADDRFSVN